MFTRFGSFLVILFWLSSMGALIAHDVWPALVAHDAPVLEVTDWLQKEGRESQASISNESGRLGTMRTIFLMGRETTQREDIILLERFPVPLVAPLRVDVNSTFSREGLLDEITIDLIGRNKMHIKLHGERFRSDFSFELSGLGTKSQRFKIPLTDAGMISGAFNPFGQMTGLRVGQTWRMQVFNPVAALTRVGENFIPMLVQVTGKERIITLEGPKDCFVVETEYAKAWVDERGVVQRQEVSLPVAGEFTIQREPFDKEAYDQLRRTLLSGNREDRN